MIRAKTANQISCKDGRLDDTLIKIEDDILLAAKCGLFTTVVGFVVDDILYSVIKALTDFGYSVTQSKYRNANGFFNLKISW
jgi:hypothetical protein